MVAHVGSEIVPLPLEEGIREMHRVDPRLYEIAQLFS
jgi:hypothetical protein